jgi:hypothetical protein
MASGGCGSSHTMLLGSSHANRRRVVAVLHILCCSGQAMPTDLNGRELDGKSGLACKIANTSSPSRRELQWKASPHIAAELSTSGHTRGSLTALSLADMGWLVLAIELIILSALALFRRPTLVGLVPKFADKIGESMWWLYRVAAYLLSTGCSRRLWHNSPRRVPSCLASTDAVRCQWLDTVRCQWLGRTHLQGFDPTCGLRAEAGLLCSERENEIGLEWILVSHGSLAVTMKAAFAGWCAARPAPGLGAVECPTLRLRRPSLCSSGPPALGEATRNLNGDPT